MHELYIAESIVSTIRKSLPDGIDISRVRTAFVQCGKLDAVIPDTLKFSFDAIKGIHGLEQARLSIEEIDVRCHCRACSNEFDLDLPLFLCPACGGSDVQVIRGRGIRLVKLNVDDSTGESDGHTDCT